MKVKSFEEEYFDYIKASDKAAMIDDEDYGEATYELSQRIDKMLDELAESDSKFRKWLDQC